MLSSLPLVCKGEALEHPSEVLSIEVDSNTGCIGWTDAVPLAAFSDHGYGKNKSIKCAVGVADFHLDVKQSFIYLATKGCLGVSSIVNSE